MQAITSELVVGFDELMRYADPLDSLLRRTEAPATARWGPLVAWMRHHRKKTPWCVLVRRDDEVVAAALLVRLRRGTVLCFETMSEPNLPSWFPARDADAADELVRAFTERLTAIRVPWILRLRALEMTDPVAAGIMTRFELARREQELPSPRLEFTPGASLNSYLSHNTRSAVAKARNRIRNAGLACAMEWTRDPARISAVVPEMADVYRERGVQLGQSVELLQDAGYQSYFADMMRAYAADGLVRLLTLRLNGELASYAMCLENAGILFVYSNRVSPDWMRYSPGTITNAEVVRAAHADPDIRGVDWGSGLERYKLSGNATPYPYQGVRAWSGKTIFHAWTGMQRVRRLAASRRNEAEPWADRLDNMELSSTLGTAKTRSRSSSISHTIR